MMPVANAPALQTKRATEYFRSAYRDLSAQVDRMMTLLLAAEWVGLVGCAIILSPRVWNGTQSGVHPHLWAAFLSGPAFIFPAIAIALLNPGRRSTRHIIAIAQMLVSALLIDITGGRLETHFHVFGSLAFLACYRDWPVLLSASAVTALDHVARGIWWPQSAYGVTAVSPWRWVEHTWWVLFEDFFLVFETRRSILGMWKVAVAKAQLYEGAYHDVLTGLANRRLLQERFDSKRRSEPDSSRAVLFIDLDRFKQANDTLGHTVGDRLLALVSARLAEEVSGADTLARIGGDEFLVLLNGISGVEEARAMGLRLLRALSKPFEVEGHRLLLSASVGISLYPDHGTELSVLQEQADRAMYVAKSKGRNQCVTFSGEIARQESTIQEITRDLSKAMVRGELQLHFQPVVQNGGELIGFEALLRWTHPVHGPISPADFIPVAEKSGLIVTIGEWVLAEACKQCRSWQRRGERPLGVAVNVSAVQFEQSDFPERMTRILRESAMDPSLLTLELTESVLIRDVSRAREHLAGLREAGVRIALDDFGTGYSSLSYLTALPADTIKLDRSFLNREFANSSAVIKSIIELAHQLGLRVVAEGVETRAQGDRLLQLNCDEMQGFYFSRPVPANSVGEMVRASRAEGFSVAGFFGIRREDGPDREQETVVTCACLAV
jgi:diguanylate cyclase (GGDEF)-like protein